MRMTAAVFVCVAAVPVATAGDSRIPTFGAHSQMVNVALTVTDKKGEFINGLTPEDFIVLEDAVRQNVAVLDRNTPPTDLILMIDASGSMDSRATGGTLLEIAKSSALQFVYALRPDDRVLVVAFTTVPNGYVPPNGELFTNDRAFLEHAIASISTTSESGRSSDTSLYTSLYTVLKQDLGKAYRRRQDPDHPRRPVIVVLTDGMDTASMITSDQVLELARLSGVAVYSILMPRIPSPTEDWRIIHDAMHFIDCLAKETGGSVSKLRSMYELKKAYQFIARELATQYRLGYQPVSEKADGKWRDIQVVVRGRPDLTVRHRKGYFAPSPK